MEHTVIINSIPEKTGTSSAPDGALCGNGDICVILGNSGRGMRIHLAKSDLWILDENPCEKIPSGITGLGYVDIDIPENLYKRYHVEQRMDRGEFFCRFSDGKRVLEIGIFASAVSNEVYIDCRYSSYFQFSQPTLHVLDEEFGDFQQTEKDGISFISRSFTEEHNVLIPVRCACAMRCFGSYEKSSKYVLTLVSSFESDECEYTAVSQAAEINERSYARICREHSEWWQSFYAKSAFSCPREPLLEMNWYASLYMLAISARNRHFPPGLYGNFIACKSVNWKGDYHLNYNFEAAFYHLCGCNHTELTDCYCAAIEDFLPVAKRFAADYTGSKGVLYPVAIMPLGLCAEKPQDTFLPDRLFLGQRSCAAYAGVIFAMRWRSARDLTFAREHAYPYIKEVCAFWEDYLVKNENGIYEIRRDAIHEIPYYRTDFNECEYSRDINARNNILSLGLVRLMLSCAADMSESLCTDDEKREKWLEILSHLADYPIFRRKGKRVFRYTSDGMKWCETNSLCIQHVYPAMQIGLSSSKKMQRTAINSLLSDDRWNDNNAISSVYPCAAVLGLKPTFILKKLKNMLSSTAYPNMLLPKDGGCLENSSVAANTLNLMLLQSHEGVLRLFPVWDRRVDCSFRTLCADGGFLVSSEMKGGKIINTVINSEKGNDLIIENPYRISRVETDGKTEVYSSDIIKLFTAPGSKIRIFPYERQKIK